MSSNGKHIPPRMAARQGDGKLHVDFITNEKVGSGVALTDEGGQCLLLLAIDTGPTAPLDQARKLQIAAAIEVLYKACRGVSQPSLILMPKTS